MADITDPQIVNFLGEMRNLAGSIARFDAMLADAVNRYVAQGIGESLAQLDDADVIIDGAVQAGWEVATVGDMESLAGLLGNLHTDLSEEGVMTIAHKLRTNTLA